MEKYDLETLKRGLKELKIELNEDQIQQFVTYYEVLVEWNSFMNLTAITEFQEVIIKHFLDSLALVNAVDLRKTESVIDIGTGAGFPGIPLKIAYPHLKITLLDSLNKRIKFLNEVIQKKPYMDAQKILQSKQSTENNMTFVYPGRLPIYPHFLNTVCLM